MIVGEERLMPGKAPSEHFDIASADSSLMFFATSSTQSAYGKTTELRGYLEVAWSADGLIALDPAPRMHVESMVESLRTGNDLQDREMWKLIDSKRFPKIAGDLNAFSPGTQRGRYIGSGQVTLAGLARNYEGEFALERDGKHLKCDGELKIDVRNFGLKPMKLLVLGIAPLVRVRLHVAAKRA